MNVNHSETDVSGGHTGLLMGRMNAPMIHSNGKKIPKKNIHPCPFRSVLRPSHTKRMIQKSAATPPIPHHIGRLLLVVGRTCHELHRAVASSSGGPTDLRLRDYRSGSHQPQKLR